MTSFTVADSVRPFDLIKGYDYYLVYNDGEFRTAQEVRRMFPDAGILSITVMGGRTIADGCDCERYDLSPQGAAAWVNYRLTAGASRPFVYASISAMGDVLSELKAWEITRDEVRLWSAHYGLGEHICGPSTCNEGKALGIEMDGTQWTNKASGALHSLIDASLLGPDFFTNSTTTWEDDLLSSIAEIKLGDTGQAVSNWQGLLIAHGHDLGATGRFRDGVDGKFEEITDAATREFQKVAALKVDGIVGPVTWTAALT